MKFYTYKQRQRIAFFGFDDLNRADASSLSKRSPQSTTGTVINDTKTLKFNLNKLFQTPLSKNAKIVMESIYLPTYARAGPLVIRTNNFDTNSYDSQTLNNGSGSTLILITETTAVPILNTNPDMFYNFSIAQNFFQNGFIEFIITYPNYNIAVTNLDRFYISLVVYDVDEEDLLLKNTPDVDYKNFGPHIAYKNTN
jgi:hypothetical protein